MMGENSFLFNLLSAILSLTHFLQAESSHNAQLDCTQVACPNHDVKHVAVMVRKREADFAGHNSRVVLTREIEYILIDMPYTVRYGTECGHLYVKRNTIRKAAFDDDAAT